jgi:flagellar basal body P-ring protein FlgI
MFKGWKALREEIKRKEEEKRLEAIKRLGELLEKIGATPEETIKIIREIREEN